MPNPLDRYVAATYFKYYALLLLALAVPMLPLLRSFALSYGYVLPMLSVAGIAAACATVLDFAFRRELTTLQRYGVEYAQVYRPLLCTTVAPIAAVCALAVVLSANRGAALCWSIIALCSATLCVALACKRSWDNAASRGGGSSL